MIFASEYFPDWTGMLGWALLHSLWQALLVVAVVVLILRFIPSTRSQFRYGITCAGMITVVALNIATLVYLLNSDHSFAWRSEIFFNTSNVIDVSPSSVPLNLTVMDHAFSFIDSHMSFIILCWVTGTLLFSMRMISGWWYISIIKSEAIVLNDQWHTRLQDIALNLGINRIISLAQSSRIHAPIVTGWLKPVILIPAGMFSGLTTEQIETIFIHELAHIRRHDYFINLIQSFIEALYFFNPFVWMISNIIRREREYCCDDTVVATHGSALAYAHALAQLEEARLSKSTFALSLAENKNQLLNRIKRIMEKSVKNYSGRERMLPAVLLVIGLICASWLTVNDESAVIQQQDANEEMIASDTIDKKKGKSATYSKTIITTYDENGEPQQQITENFEGDDELRSIMPDLAFDFHMPQFPVKPSFPKPLAIPGAPGIPDFDVMIPHFPDLHFDIDSIPLKHFRHGSEKDWEEFSKAFEEKFSEQFGEFYNSHEKDFEKMMKELEETFSESFNEEALEELRNHEWEFAARARSLAEMERSQQEVFRDATEQARKAAEQARKHVEQLNKEAFEKQEYVRMFQQDQLMAMEERLKATEAKMELFKKELKELLVEDGYIGENDEIKNINWDDDGEIEVNGKKIKNSDRKKYNALHRKYFAGDY